MVNKSKIKTFLAIILGIIIVLSLGLYILYRAYLAHIPIKFSYIPSQDTHVTTGNFGTDFSRIDSQITLEIPDGKAAEIYAYIRNTYIEQEGLLKNEFPYLSLRGEQQIDISEFTDLYFDTAFLDLYQSNNTVRFRHRENTTNKNDPKSGRELIQVKITPADRFDLRNELKFKAKPGTIQSNNTSKKGITLLDLVASSLQEDFKKAIMPLNPYELRYMLTLKQKRSRAYLDLDNKNFLSFSVDEGNASIWGTKAKFSSVDVGLVETAYTEADEITREKMRQINTFIINDLKKHFPYLKTNSQDKYVIVLSQIMPQIQYFKLWRLLGLI